MFRLPERFGGANPFGTAVVPISGPEAPMVFNDVLHVIGYQVVRKRQGYLKLCSTRRNFFIPVTVVSHYGNR